METITKEEITKLINKNKEKEPEETIFAIRITSYGIQIMILGFIWWILFYFGFLTNNVEGTIIATLIGSTLLGVSIFIISSGTNLYYRFHNKIFSPHWLYKVLMKTIIQFYYFSSFLLIFITTRSIYIESNVEFIIIFILLSTPGVLGYPLSYLKKVEEWFDKKATHAVRTSIEKSLTEKLY